MEETIRQAEQKFKTDLETIATETTNDEKLLKTLVYPERRTAEEIPERKQGLPETIVNTIRRGIL